MWRNTNNDQFITASDRTFNNKRLLTFVFASIVLLYFIFAPGIISSFYAGDDSRYAFGGYSQHCSGDDGFGFMLTLGRPIQAYLDCINYKIGYTFERMSMIRFFAVALLGCGMGLLAEIFCYFGFAFWTAFFAAGSICMLPKLYGDTVITSAISLPAALVFILLAYYCISKTFLLQKNKLSGFGLAALFIYAALLTYPAMAFFFCSLMLAKTVFSKLSDLSKTRREIILGVVLFIGVCIIYFIWATYNMRYHALAPVPPQYRTDHPNFNMTEIAARMALLGNVFTIIWEILPGGNMIVQGWVTIVVLASGILAGLISFFKSPFYSQNNKQALFSLAQVIIAVIALFILSSAFFLVIPERDLGGRLLYGTAFSGMVLIFWCVFQIGSIFPALLRSAIVFGLISLLFLTEAYHANRYVMIVASSYANKMALIKTIITDHLAKDPKLRRIHFILVKPDYPYTRFFLANAGLMQIFPRGSYDIQWCSLQRGVPEDEPGHQKEALACINGLKENGIAITYSYLNEPFTKTDHMLIINNKDHTF